MQNTHSKTKQKLGPVARFKLARAKNKDKRAYRKATKVKLHKSFKRSYREDYIRETKLPGLLSHANATFKIFFKNWSNVSLSNDRSIKIYSF